MLVVYAIAVQGIALIEYIEVGRLRANRSLAVCVSCIKRIVKEKVI